MNQPRDRDDRALTREQVAEVLRKAGYSNAAQDALRELPDRVGTQQLRRFSLKHGIFRDDLISQMGGSP